MLRYVWIFIALGGLAQASPLGEISGGVEVGFYSRYTWRGMQYSTGPAVQPYGWITAGPLTVSGWGDANLSRKDPDQGLDGGDLMAVWSQDFGRWRIEPGFEFWFDRPVNNMFDPATGEVSTRVSYGSSSLRVFALQAADVIKFQGAWYGETGLNFTPKWRGLEWEGNLRQAFASGTFNREYTGVAEWAPTYFGGDASVTKHLGKSFYVRLHGEATRMEHREIRQALRQSVLASADVSVGWETPAK